MTGVSTLGQALDQIERLKNQQTQLSTLSLQLSTGRKTQKFSGLATDLLTSKRARADFGSVDTYLSNIQNADRRMKLMLTAVEEFKAQAENFVGLLTGFSQESAHQQGEVIYYDDPLTTAVEQIQVGMTSADPDVDLRTLQDFATKINDFMISLMNTQENDRYLFSGSDTLNKPIEDNGLLDSATSTLITQWKAGTITTDELIADFEDRTSTNGNTDALTDSIVGYSAELSANNVEDIFVRVSRTAEVEYTVLANEQAFRDVMVAVSFFKNENLGPIADAYLDGDPPYPAPPSVEGAPGDTVEESKNNFYAVFNNLIAMVNNSIDSLDQLRFKLEGSRAQIDQIKKSHEAQRNLLQNTIDDVENADISEVAVKLNALETQLDASYRVTARIQQLSLVNFI